VIRPAAVITPFAVALALGAPRLAADVSGVVRDPSFTPIAGAQVRLQTTTAPVVTAAADGSFTLPVTFAGTRVVTASLPYDPLLAVNYNSGGVNASDGQTGLSIILQPIPDASAGPPTTITASYCGSCHEEQHAEWQTSNHALAGVDAWVLDLFSGTGTPGGSAGYVFKNLHDPGESGFCATCHAALEDVANPGNVLLDAVATVSGLDGVNCQACHQIDSVNANASALHHLGNATYRFPDELGGAWRFVWGPLGDVRDVMRNAEAAVFTQSRFCGSCHEYNNPTTNAPGQTTYSEWQASPYAVPGPAFRTCQNCHMPAKLFPGALTNFGEPIRPGDQRHEHAFVGATPATLQAAITLGASAVEVGSQIQVTAQVANQGAGHSFPTGISIRNALLVVSASFQGTPLVQTSGPTIPFWADDDVPGPQPGDYAGQPGKGFARILEGRINGTGPVVRPVLFIDAENVFSDTLIAAGQTDMTMLTFALPPGIQPGDIIDVSVRLLYRRAFRATAVTKGWTQTPAGGPIEIEIAQQNLQVTVTTPVELQSFRLE
jgi:nitrate/TMAO reductase-like tetraheme cytochrome c subunit